MTDNSEKAIQKYRVYIKATPQTVWDALTKPEWSVRYGYAPLVDYDLRAGGQFRAYPNEGMKQFPNIPDIIIMAKSLKRMLRTSSCRLGVC